ncbi:MAG: ATP-dependent protease ATPase subunit HslU [Spirochaetaceae bacterium]|jgi:ATP-dependent HslUV protease ATP-binding subunit HslU|nr:ATP-dependent protease ATPase subunit HslU [Spirochaetaceae bacterium]
MKGIEEMTPAQIVAELDKYIIGQEKAKKSVAIALRNRIRRSRLDDDIRDEVMPRNIIMIGPTGVGKTEIARRLAKLARAPFIKVEATKFTEVGYVGRDVESMVRDLLSSAISMVKQDMKSGVEDEAKKATEEQLLDLLLPGTGKRPSKPSVHPNKPGGVQLGTISISPQGIKASSTPPMEIQSQEIPQVEEKNQEEEDKRKESKEHLREVFRKKLHDGELEDRVIEVQVSKQSNPMVEIMAGGQMDGMGMDMGGMLSGIFGGGKKNRKVTVKQARELLLQENIERLIDSDNAIEEARELTQNMGIIFIDEIDKIAVRRGTGGGQDVSREGVQRDILPIVEGSTVNTRHGIIDTSHILFIAAGAFSMSKPSDLIPELQGRFPLRVELEDLDAEAFKSILTAPRNALTKQYQALMATEGVELEFDEESIIRLAEIAAEVNRSSENIGARRLYTIMELLLEELSFDACDRKGEKVQIDKAYVNQRLANVVEDKDLSRYIL